MPILVSCPNCRTSLKAPDSAAGRDVKCPSCGTPFPVPYGGADIPQEAARQPQGYDDRGPYRDDYRRDDYDDRPPPRYERREPEGQGTGVQLGFGVASLSIGAVGIVVALIPCIGWYFGLWIGGLGLVLGLVGLIVGMCQKGRGL